MVQSILEGHAQFPDRDSAVRRLEALSRQFILSRHQPPEGQYPDPAIIFWIRGFAVTEEEAQQGYTGHYCLVRVEPMAPSSPAATGTNHQASTRYQLTAAKLPSELSIHPQIQRPKSRHPNWGHPVLRSVKKGKVYFTLDEVQAEFEQLHGDYPDCSILCTHKLYTIIYSKQHEGNPAQKYVLEPIPDRDGLGYIIEAKPNQYIKPASLKPGQSTEVRPVGYFTAKAQMGHKKPGASSG
jgi:hypothetical protein